MVGRGAHQAFAEPMTDRFTIAHVSDVHLAPLPPFWPWHWNVKRALGYANWLRKRKFEHRRATTDRMVADLKRQLADHIVVSGDLTNIGMPREHEWALRWLEALGSFFRLTVCMYSNPP